MQGEIVSKTKRKREMHELQALGVELVELPESQLGEMSLAPDLLQAVRIGNENYMLSGDGLLMPTRKGQAAPDLKYFKQNQK